LIALFGLLRVTNVSVTPYTYTDDFVGDDAVLSRDNLKIAFKVHTVWRVNDQRVPLFMERFSTTITDSGHESSPDAIVNLAYQNFVREPLRTFARDEVQRRNGLDVKEALVEMEQKERTKREVHTSLWVRWVCRSPRRSQRHKHHSNGRSFDRP
jgi:regulator of protease activity HflC (stomatin/prohibitin superfamily)